MNLRAISYALGLALVVFTQNVEGRVVCNTVWGPWSKCIKGTRHRFLVCSKPKKPANCNYCPTAKEFDTC